MIQVIIYETDDICEFLEQSVVDGDTDRIDWFIKQDGGVWNNALLIALEIDDGETYRHIANGEIDDPEMLESVVGLYSREGQGSPNAADDGELQSLLRCISARCHRMIDG